MTPQDTLASMQLARDAIPWLVAGVMAWTVASVAFGAWVGHRRARRNRLTYFEISRAMDEADRLLGRPEARP